MDAVMRGHGDGAGAGRRTSLDGKGGSMDGGKQRRGSMSKAPAKCAACRVHSVAAEGQLCDACQLGR